MNISQSLMNAVLSADACAKSVFLKHVAHTDNGPSDLMLKGQYFEFKLIGATRSGEVVVLPKLKAGGPSADEKAIDILVDIGKTVMKKMGIDLEKSEAQIEIIIDGEEGHIDLVANDITTPGRRAIYDVKYTETKFDDRWNGWADLSSLPDSMRQARHYVRLWHKKHGEYLPYYFFIFGKSGWCRVYKCTVSRETMDLHQREIDVVKGVLEQWKREGWPASPAYEKCKSCRASNFCDQMQTLPDIEIIAL
jgi:hypothetical protein